MNDIGIKLVESPKDRLAEASPTEVASENEVDPLSIEDVKDPLLVTGKICGDKEICEDDAKEPINEAKKECDPPQACEAVKGKGLVNGIVSYILMMNEMTSSNDAYDD